jgi:hypothetical protein
MAKGRDINKKEMNECLNRPALCEERSEERKMKKGLAKLNT